MLLWIIGVLLGGGLFQFILRVWFNNSSIWSDWVAASVQNILSGKVWTLVTYALGHDGPLHLLVNVLLVYFIGRALEPVVGQNAVLRCFLLAVFVGGLAWFGVHLATGQALLIGASAGALGLLFLFCALRPEQSMTLLLFFIVPVTLKPKWIAYGLLAFNGFGLLFSEMPLAFGVSEGIGMGPVAFSAHMGGMLVGYLYARYLRRPAPARASRQQGGVRIEMPEWMRNKRSKAAAATRYQVNVSSKAAAAQSGTAAATAPLPPSADEVDRILDKINQEGFGSLSAEERGVLDRAGERFRR